MDYNLNCVLLFKKESIVYYIKRNRLHIWYVFICTIQARGEYKGQSYECHVAIMSSLDDLMQHQSLVIVMSY